MRLSWALSCLFGINLSVFAPFLGHVYPTRLILRLLGFGTPVQPAILYSRGVNGVEQMVSMHSRCGSDGSYTLTVVFPRGTDLDMAKTLIENRVRLALPLLPDAVQRHAIMIKEKSPGFLMVINLSSPDGRHDPVYLSNYATIIVKDELSRLRGVSDIVFVGQSDWRSRINVDEEKLATHDLTVIDVVQAIQQQQALVAGGLGKFLPPPRGRFLDPQQVNDIIVKAGPGAVILRLKDLARLELAAVERSTSRFNGKRVVSLFVYSLAQADRKELKADLELMLSRLRERLPEGLSLDVAFDFTTSNSDHVWLDVNLPDSASRERTDQVLRNAEKVLRKVDSVEDVLELGGPPFAPLESHGCILVRLASAGRNGTGRDEIIQAIRARMREEIIEAMIRPRDLSGRGRLPPGDYPLSLAIHGPDLGKVREFAELLTQRLVQNPKLTDVCVNPELRLAPGLSMDVDRDKARELGVPLDDVTRTLAVCFGSPVNGLEQFDLRWSRGIRANENGHVMVRSNTGKQFPLRTIVNVREGQPARVLNRLDLLPMEEITGNPAVGVSLAEARSICASVADAVREELRLAPEYRLTWQ